MTPMIDDDCEYFEGNGVEGNYFIPMSRKRAFEIAMGLEKEIP